MPAAPTSSPAPAASGLRLLAFDTSTEAMSIALADGERVFAHEGPGGAHSSATLIPHIQQLLAEAGLALEQLDAIAFGRGPGSFTGLRTACAVAQGLGFGAGLRLLPVDTLLAVAEEARHRFGAERVVALLDARMDQVYAAAHDLAAVRNGRGDGQARVEAQLLAPEEVVAPAGWVLAGNAFAAYADRLPPAVERHPVLPTAGAMLRLAPYLLASGGSVAPAEAWPSYVRDKVAQTTEERAAQKAAHRIVIP